MSGHSYEHGAMTTGVARVAKFSANGIGLPIAEEPSHTTVRTDRVYGGSADQEA